MQGVQDGLNRAQQNKVLLENSLQSGQETAAVMARFAQTTGVSAASASSLGSDPRSIKSLEAQLAELRTRYTEDYPEVQSVKASLAEAKRRAAELQASTKRGKSEGGTAAGPADAAVNLEKAETDDPALAATMAHERERLDDLKAQQTIATKQITTLNAERQQILEKIASIQVHVDRLPVREQQLASITRDYEITKANYKSLLDKKLAAGMAADMEKRQKSERFTMIEPARVPEVPSKPNRPLIAGIGAFISVLVAIAFPIGKSVQENVVLGEWELPKDSLILGRVPVIAAKEIRDRSPRRLMRSSLAKFGLAFVVAMVVLGIGANLFFRWFSL